MSGSHATWDMHARSAFHAALLDLSSDLLPDSLFPEDANPEGSCVPAPQWKTWREVPAPGFSTSVDIWGVNQPMKAQPFTLLLLVAVA